MNHSFPRWLLALWLVFSQLLGVGLVVLPAGSIFLMTALFLMVGEGLTTFLILLVITIAVILAIMGLGIAAWMAFSRGLDNRAAILSSICFFLGAIYYGGYTVFIDTLPLQFLN